MQTRWGLGGISDEPNWVPASFFFLFAHALLFSFACRTMFTQFLCQNKSRDMRMDIYRKRRTARTRSAVLSKDSSVDSVKLTI